jgi:NADPH:quinone reductase
MSTQKALVVTALNEPVSLVTDRPVPLPGPRQVQVRVTVAGLNPHDAKARDYGLFIANSLPAVLTNDVVGVVTKLGEDVPSTMADVKVGDRVVFQAAFKGERHESVQNGLQEHAVADIDFLARIPDSVTDDEAATIPTTTIAPLVALFDTLGIPAPWTEEARGFEYEKVTLLVVGGGSNCGKFGVQLAKLAGVGRIVVVGGDESELGGYGATHVLGRHGGDDVVLERIRSVVGDELVYAFDAVNAPDGLVLALNALSNSKKGTVARLLPIGPVDETKVKGKMAGFEVKDVFGSSHAKPELAREFWARLPQYLEDGTIKPAQFVVKDGLKAEHVNEVLDAYRDGKSVTKTHIHL